MQTLRPFHLIFVLTLCLTFTFGVVASRVLLAAPSHFAPDFTLSGIDGKPYTLSQNSGKPIVLFFFCGCRWCHDTARSWALEERKNATAKDIHTVIVYSDGPQEAADFVKQTGLNPSSTTVLLDRYLHVTLSLYHAAPCPRVFVISPDLTVDYTNNHADDAPETVAANILVAKVSKAAEAALGMAVSDRGAAQLTSPLLDQSVYLTPIVDSGVSSAVGVSEDPHTAQYDFGTLKQNSVSTVKHVFELRNDSGKSISIDHIQPSCGCTNAFINDTADFPVDVKPGQTIKVTTFVDLRDLFPTAVEKSVMIFKKDQINPVATVEITGELTSD